MSKNKQINTRHLVCCAALIALAMVTSNLKLFRMPMGGSVTCMSMLFISLAGYWYGLGTGLTTAVSYGLLQLFINPYVISLPQLFIDYLFAFGALGLSGLFSNKKHGLYTGYLVGILGRFLFTFLSGVLFFGSSAADFGMSAILYSMCYNGAYIFSEAALTLAVLALPPIKNTLIKLKGIVNV